MIKGEFVIVIPAMRDPGGETTDTITNKYCISTRNSMKSLKISTSKWGIPKRTQLLFLNRTGHEWISIIQTIKVVYVSFLKNVWKRGQLILNPCIRPYSVNDVTCCLLSVTLNETWQIVIWKKKVFPQPTSVTNKTCKNKRGTR